MSRGCRGRAHGRIGARLAQRRRDRSSRLSARLLARGRPELGLAYRRGVIPGPGSRASVDCCLQRATGRAQLHLDVLSCGTYGRRDVLVGSSSVRAENEAREWGTCRGGACVRARSAPKNPFGKHPPRPCSSQGGAMTRPWSAWANTHRSHIVPCSVPALTGPPGACEKYGQTPFSAPPTATNHSTRCQLSCAGYIMFHT